ncbi:ribonuclease H-like domain-containing protein [Tanacetum coccineum]
MEMLETENVSLEFKVQSLMKEHENIKLEYHKLFDSIKKTRIQTQGEINELIENVNQKTYAYGDVRAKNQDLLITISELKAKLKNVEKGEDDQNINNQPPNLPPPTQQAPHIVSTIKLPILKKDTQGQIKIMPPKSAEEILARERERKPRITLLMDLSEDHLARFQNISDVKEMWDAIKTRFGGNAKNTGYKGRDQRTGKQEQLKALLTIDAGVIDWSGQAEEKEEDHALMAFNSNSSSNEVQSCSDECVALYNKLKQLYDEQREQLGDASREIQAYTQALKKVEVQLVAHQQSQLCQMSAKDKAELGTSNIEDSPVNDRYADGMHVVPPPMTGIYIPSRPDKEIDDSQFTYGLKQSKPSESDAKSSDFNSCESNYSEETHESMPEPVVNESKVDQTVLGKDYSNLLIADSLLKTIWFINAPCYGNEALASPKANGVCCDAEEMRCKFKIESESLGHNLFSVGQFCDGARDSNLYTISISDMTASSPVLLVSKATLTKSWLWHRRLSHLNFDEAPEMIKKFIAQVQLNFNIKIQKVRTDNGTEFQNETLQDHYEKLGIIQ